MQVDARTKRRLRLQNTVFLLLFLSLLGLLGWLSLRYDYQADWSANQRNTASEATRAVLAGLEQPIRVRAFVGGADPALRQQIERLLERYRRAGADIRLEFIDPATEPALVREQGISREGELLVEYGERKEHLLELSEQALTNALQRLRRSGERWIVFLSGHDERSPNGDAGYDYRAFARELRHRGLQVRELKLASENTIPEDTSVLVIADPQAELLEGEQRQIQTYLEGGGNLLWLVEPGPLHGLDGLAEQLGVDPLPGVIVDPNTQLLGLGDPRLALVADYPFHPITRDFDTLTLFPVARGLESNDAGDWDSTPFLETLPRSWAESGELSGEITLDPGEDIAGPLTLGLALDRNLDSETDEETEHPDRRQRVVVIGDADFLSDSYLGQGGNLDLGLNIVNWLSHDDALINIPAKTAPDRQLQLSSTAQAVIGFGFLLVLPLGLLLCGLIIWWRRRRA